MGFSSRKRPILRTFIPESHIEFISSLEKIPKQSTLVLWGKYHVDHPENFNIIRVEDGFLRSVGLGADLIPPSSWVIDCTGLYYDATQTSDLEHLLETTIFSKELIERAKKLRAIIVEKGISKYNIGLDEMPMLPEKQKKILVVGQVESDASIRNGNCCIQTNLALLKQVRSENPSAYLIYKPHPDVQAGLRARGIGEGQASLYCDKITPNVSIIELLNVVDEVHVMTSLTGFEALLRNKLVHCYGHPFYAGWGLTQDKTPIPRRTRQLSIDELVAAALLIYPRYVSQKTGQLITAEDAIQELLLQKGNKISVWRYLFRPFLRLLAEIQRRA